MRPTDARLPTSYWQARLELDFERRGAETVLTRNLHRGPLQVQKALYPEGRGTCHVAILHPPGGIAARDTLALGASLRGASNVLLTTPGATKWYRSEGDWASQEVSFTLEDGAILEWLPRENIVFDGSQVSTRLDVALSADARYFGWDIVSFGRRASGERWRQGRLRMRTSIRCAERLLWSEVADVDAASGFGDSTVGLAGFGVCGTFLVAGYDVDAGLLARCRGSTPAAGTARRGITCMPRIWVARCLGDSTEEVFAWFTDLWEILRPALTARTMCAPRVWAC